MSAPGIQLGSQPEVSYFQPTIRQYLRGIKEAVASNNLPAARQAFAQLTKAIPSSAQGTSAPTGELPARITENMQGLRNALETGDHSAAQHAVAELRLNFQAVSEGQSQQRQSATLSPTSHEVASGDRGISEGGPNLSVKA